MAKGFMATMKGRVAVVMGFMLICMIAGGAMGYVQAAAESQPSGRQGMIWALLPIAIIFAGISFWVGALWMKSIDEAAQEAHKWSWYWGGSAGLAVAMIGYAISFLPEAAQWALPTISGRTDPVAYAVTGGLFVIGLLIAGYTVAWGLWWFQRR